MQASRALGKASCIAATTACSQGTVWLVDYCFLQTACQKGLLGLPSMNILGHDGVPISKAKAV